MTFNLGFIYYWYPGSRPSPTSINGTNSNIDYLEGKAGYSVAWKQIKNLTTGTTLYFSGDGTFNTGRYWILESTASYTLPIGDRSRRPSAAPGVTIKVRATTRTSCHRWATAKTTTTTGTPA